MPRNLRQPQRPPTIRVPTELGLGSRTYRYNKGPYIASGFGEPPPGFLIASTSVSEWAVYWALSKIYGDPKDPRVGPYIGAPGIWEYQSPLMGGRGIGGSVMDFLIKGTPSGTMIGIRLQTELWHLYTTNKKQASDLLKRQRLEEMIEVVDLYDYTFMGDASGQLVVQAVKSAIGMIEIPNPLRAGTARRNKRTGLQQ